MHEKVEHLFAQNTHRQKDIRQNKLPVPLLTLSVPQKLKKLDFWDADKSAKFKHQ